MRKVLYILGQLSDDDVEWLANVGQRQTIAQGSVLIREGEPLSSLYVILDGRFEILAHGVGRFAVVGCGEVLGEISLIDSRSPIATATALEDAIVLKVDKDVVARKLAEDIGFAAHFYHAISTFLADRLRTTVKRLGYGEGGSLDGGEELEGELDADVLDNLVLAGARFDRILKRFLG